MEKSIIDLIEISRYYGSNTDYIVGGGGNTSYKDDRYLWIKASGYALATITEDGFAKLDRKKMHVIATKEYDKDPHIREEQVKDDLMASNADPDFIRRPSVEASLHELINYPFVVHTHPALVNSLMCSNNAEQMTNELFGKDILFIPYVDPGYILYKKISEELASFREKYHKEPAMIFLQNHGVFVGAESIEEIRILYDNIFEKIRYEVEEVLSVVDKEVSDDLVTCGELVNDALGGNMIIKARINTLIGRFVKEKSSIEEIFYPFIPDGIVYCRTHPLVIHEEDNVNIELITSRINEYRNKYRCNPRIVLMEGQGMIGIEENEMAVDLVLDMFEDAMNIALNTKYFGGSHFMDPDSIRFIEDWEVEKYRRQLSTKA